MTGQAWFWTPEWQAGERQADADIAAGRVVSFEAADAPWDTALDVDPPTEQPDQHEHGDSCDAEECCE